MDRMINVRELCTFRDPVYWEHHKGYFPRCLREIKERHNNDDPKDFANKWVQESGGTWVLPQEEFLKLIDRPPLPAEIEDDLFKADRYEQAADGKIEVSFVGVNTALAKQELREKARLLREKHRFHSVTGNAPLS